MKKPSWGSDSSKYKGLKREKVIDWLNRWNDEPYEVTAARVDLKPVYFENMFDQSMRRIELKQWIYADEA